jgi:hypothetical protein
MAGCAENPKPVPVAIDLAPQRCPELAAADTKPFGERPAAPPAGDLTASRLKAWIDAREMQLARVQHAGGRVINQYEACRAPSRVAQAGASQ